jgi:hypothetical protein
VWFLPYLDMINPFACVGVEILKRQEYDISAKWNSNTLRKFLELQN